MKHLIFISIFFLASCDNAFTSHTPDIGFVGIPSSYEKIFNDNIVVPESTNIANPDLNPNRLIKIKELVEMSFVGGRLNHRLQVHNFSPLDVYGVEFYGSANGGRRHSIVRSKLIPAYSRIELVIDVSKFGWYENDTIDFSSSGGDSNMQLLNSINVGWEVYFGGRPDDTDKIWLEYNGLQLKQYMIYILNMAHIVSTQDFAGRIRNADLRDNNKDPITSDLYLNQLRNFKRVDFKIFNHLTDSSIAGLGGGHLVSVSISEFNSFISGTKRGNTISNWYGNLFIHELNHAYGYSHDSTMTYSDNTKPTDQRFDLIVGNMYAEYFRTEKLPFSYGRNGRKGYSLGN